MPRGRGGSRQGKPGTSYSNRSDLNAPKPAIAVAPSAGYGQAQAQLEAQRAVPVGPSPTQQPIPGQPGQPAPAAPTQVMPGSLGALTRPTENPNEPLTSGISMGPGPGPEALRQIETPDEQDLAAFFPYLGMLEFMVSQPDSSVATRNFVRRLRGAIPLVKPPDPTTPSPEEV